MDTFLTLQMDVRDRLDSSLLDTFYSTSRIQRALNTALTGAADRLGATSARRRYMKRISDLSLVSGADGTWDDVNLKWTLPITFRRPYRIGRTSTEIAEVKHEDEFSAYGANGYMVIGRELWLTANTDPDGLEVFYYYKPAKMVLDADEPDWVEGYEEYLVLRAAALLMPKGDIYNPEQTLRAAALLWSDILIAARQSTLPATINSRRTSEDWG